jgi:hypothetical protein
VWCGRRAGSFRPLTTELRKFRTSEQSATAAPTLVRAGAALVARAGALILPIVARR